MKKIIVFSILLVSIFTVIALFQRFNDKTPSSPQGKVETVTSEIKSSAVEILATNLEIPWSLDFLPNGDILFTQRTGDLKLLSESKISTIATIPDVKVFGEGGLMGLTLHPDFETNNYIYLMFTYGNEGNDTLNRVVRYKLINNSLSDRIIIVDDIPGARFHNGGRIKFGPDGFLYITTGDSQNPSFAQSRESLAGKILRVTEDGSSAPGNPFNSAVYSYGHRNPQGITWDTQGNLWQTEHGRSLPTGYDEVNLIKVDKNYGWPTIEGDEARNGMVTPVANSGLGTWAPGSALYLNGSIFFGGLKPEALFQLKLDKEKPVLIEHFKNQFGRIRDVVIGPDNMIYITTSNQDGRGNPASSDDRIIRIDPTQLNSAD